MFSKKTKYYFISYSYANHAVHKLSCLFKYISIEAIAYLIMYLSTEEKHHVVIYNILEIEKMSYDHLKDKYEDLTKKVNVFMDDLYGID